MSTQAITAVLDSLADAWAKGDADAYGAHFTKDASYITFVGTIYHNTKRKELMEAISFKFAPQMRPTR